MSQAIFKFNSGIRALLCSKCSTIIKDGYEFNSEEILASKGKIHMNARYCEICSDDNSYNKNKMILKRLDDGLVNYGSRLYTIKWKSDDSLDIKTLNGGVVVGCSVKLECSDSWWLTTKVTKIIEEQYHKGKLTYCQFQTENSTYELKIGNNIKSIKEK